MLIIMRRSLCLLRSYMPCLDVFTLIVSLSIRRTPDAAFIVPLLNVRCLGKLRFRNCRALQTSGQPLKVD